MITDAQKTFIWKSFDRRRLEFLPYARRKFTQALNRQLLQFERATADVVIIGDLVQGIGAITQAPIKEAFEDVYPRVAGTFAVFTTQQLKHSKGYIEKDYTVSDYQDAITAWVAENTGARIVGITQTTQQIVQKVIQQAFDEGLSIAQSQRLIRSKFALMTAMRAERIARTEIVSASNLGSLEGARATGLLLKKSWLATRDDRTRDDHADADGQQVGLNENFTVGGELMKYPGDMDASAGNVINCRCALIYEE